ncbi:TonB-dependent siderophore receptor [Paracoccus shanxieyensis]|uniref:TonB-dependent siderophore receptor n=1 Tax=Paracoccus shanxieyensis TaxID=2675752 RepID=A0A6L6IV73_9RHOB|nr:TonB-dependent siderophore receptor [Paracoccus shanxieyensis]MTH64103.1 TonB-dependent siderophore receptor [Paracoccus shanxieyensis]MTH86856.1 TonB-dependent siderophore receptor [Paracoccus shanxieyensis]
MYPVIPFPGLYRSTALCAGVLTVLANSASAQDADPARTTVLDEVVITAAPATTTEDSNSWTTEWMRSATGLVLSQKETPQSTSVITHQQMQDRNITTISETLEAATGITVQAYESDRTNYYSRGFPIDAYQYDGVPIPRDGVWQFGDNNPDMALYDHVEIVRGATGLMQGAGEPGASINFVRKRPTQDFRSEAAVSLAYPKGGRVESDISGPLNDSGTIRGRLVGVVDSRDGILDGYHKDKYVLFGALEADLTDSTILSTGLSYQKTNADGVTWGGLQPFFTDGGLIDWDKGASTGQDWTYVNTKRTEFYASLEHVFQNGWTGRLVYTHVKNDMDATLAWLYGTPDRITGDGLSGYGTRYDGGYKQNNLNAILNGDFQAFGRDHQFVLGAMYSKGEGKYFGYGAGATQPVNIYRLNDMPAPVLSDTATYTDASEAKQYAIYATGRFGVTEQLHILAGARVNWWDGATGDGTTNSASYRFSGEVTPYVGFTYDITPTYTAYGSVASIYKPTLSQDVNRQYLDPTYGWNYELGLKADLMDGALQASAAVFQTDQKDVAQYLYWIPEENRSVYTSIDGTATRGFELELAGAINDRWNVSGGYTYRESEDRDGNPLYVDQPKHTLKLATDYRVPNLLDDKLTIGGALRWQSDTDSMDFTSNVEQPNVHQGSYTVFDLNTSYQIDARTELSMSVNNVFDKKYYSTTGFSDTVVYGEARTAEITLRAKF